MATHVNIRGQRDALRMGKSTPVSLKRVFGYLPISLCGELEGIWADAAMRGASIEEIRIRSGRRVYLTVGGGGERRNLLLRSVLSESEVSDMLNKMCDGSLYAYGESILKGYIALSGGIRVGVCGRARLEGEKMLGVCDISALNIRLPCERVLPSPKILRAVREAVAKGEGILIYSPPAQGKTTLLRSLAYELSGGEAPLRVALVDSREEMGASLDGGELCLDVLSGYPQAEAIRIATAFMNPQVIICDEIGREEDAEAIAQAQNAGVPLIASAHGDSAEGVIRRGGMERLHAVGAFGLYIGIRIGTSYGFEYKVQKREEVGIGNNRRSGTCF